MSKDPAALTSVGKLIAEVMLENYAVDPKQSQRDERRRHVARDQVRMSRHSIPIAALLLALTVTANAQQASPTAGPSGADLVHYSYGTLLGTGIYKLDDRTVTVFRIPIGWTFREPTREKFGIALKVPTAVGFHDFGALDELIPRADQLGTVSVVPGLELQYLVGENWRIAPSVYLGFGMDLSNDDSSVIYGAGISALRPLKVELPEMNFGTAMVLSGYDPRTGTGDYVTRWSAGFDAKIPTGWRFDDRDVFVGGHVIGYYYMSRLEFQTIVDEPIELRAELEFGFFLGARPAPKIFGVTIDRLGMGYRFSDVSDALVLFASFPF